MVVGMDHCEEDWIIVCGIYFIVEEQERKIWKYWIRKVFRAREEEVEFRTLFETLKNDSKIFSSSSE
jgi:hypothetical protein